MENQTSSETSNRGTLFLVAIVLMTIFSFLSLGIDIDEYKQSIELDIPQWYFYQIFAVDILILLAVALMFFYRKVGVILFPLAVGTHFIFHNYYLSTFLYTDVMNLFLFVGIGLLAFIPKWQFFK